MRLLLDTHSFLWFVLNDAQLSAPARTAISDPANDVLDFIQHNIDANDFDILPIEVRHTALVAAMPFHHRDPFDRLLIAQALVEDIPLVSNEALFDAYGIRRLW